MDRDEFRERLCALRMQKNVSARDMSLSIGQSAGYINNIENGINMPSMAGFFYICEYLGVTPQEFFDTGTSEPEKIQRALYGPKKLDAADTELILAHIERLGRR